MKLRVYFDQREVSREIRKGGVCKHIKTECQDDLNSECPLFQVIYEGNLTGMRTEKDDVSSASEGMEVGLKFSKDFGIEVDDKVVCYRTFKVEQSVDWDLGF